MATTELEKNLGIMIAATGRNTEPLEAAVNKASWALGIIRKPFRYFDISLFKKLYPITPRIRVCSMEQHVSRRNSKNRESTV